MTEPIPTFGADLARDAWDGAADAYTRGQANGRDVFRYHFFGPAQVRACGEVSGVAVLDVGCGNGYFAREMAARGARVTGVDLSPRMIAHARRMEDEAPLGIAYHVADAAEIAALFPPASFDLAVSCMAMQDVPEVPAVLAAVHAVLRPGGRFIASITHPCTETPLRRWERAEDGTKRWLCIDRYFERGPIDCEWSGWGEPTFTTPALHATIEDWFAWITGAGFTVRGFREPRPTDEAIRAVPRLQAAARVPYYIIFDLARGDSTP